MTKGKCRISATTKAKFEKMVNECFYSSNWVLTDKNLLYNTRLKKSLDGFTVEVKGGRYRLRDAKA